MDVIKKGALKNCAKFTEVAGLRPPTLSKRDSSAGIFL